MAVERMVSTITIEEDVDTKRTNSRRKCKCQNKIGSFATVFIIFGLLLSVGAQGANNGPQGNTGRYYEKMLALKHRIAPDAKSANLLHGIRIKRSFDCKKEADDKLMGFIKSFRAVGSKYLDLFKNIGSLKCIYLNLGSKHHKVKHSDITLCPAHENIRIPLNYKIGYGSGFENFKLNDRNIKDPEALGRYVRLFSQVLPSLRNIKNMEKSITSSTRSNYLKLIETVERDWIKLQNDIMETKKAYSPTDCEKLCDESNTKIPDDIVRPYTPAMVKLLHPGISKEEIAASLFNQMLLILDIMEEDLEHRRKCLR